ncbi:MAG: DUF5684 domain-containing protein [Phycisphaerae bacterium]|nr:DUF5684 domain-containing protein [Phycisphaerae bacterium]
MGFIIYLAVMVLVIVGMWKTFAKAGRPGWACLVPFYNAYVACEIARLPILWFILAILPIVSIVGWIVICMKIAENFGKTGGYGVGLALLGFVFFPMLGLSDAKYQGTAGIAQDTGVPSMPSAPAQQQAPAEEPPQE